MKCPCQGCTDRTMTCKYAGQCERWENWKAEDLKKKQWLRDQKPFMSERMLRKKDMIIKEKARGWKRSGGSKL